MKLKRVISVVVICSIFLQNIAPAIAADSHRQEEAVNLLRDVYEEIQSRRAQSHRSIVELDISSEMEKFKAKIGGDDEALEKSLSLLKVMHSLLTSTANEPVSVTEAGILKLIHDLKEASAKSQILGEKVKAALLSPEIIRDIERQVPVHFEDRKYFLYGAAWLVSMISLWSLIYFGAFSCAPPSSCVDGSEVTADSYLSPYCGECTSYGFQMWGTVCKEGTIGMIQDSEDPGFHQCLKQTYILTGIMGSIGLLPLFYASYLSGSGFAKKSYERLTNSSPIDRTAESEAAQIEIRKLEDAVEHKIANISQETGISFVREILEEVLSQPSMQ